MGAVLEFTRQLLKGMLLSIWWEEVYVLRAISERADDGA